MKTKESINTGLWEIRAAGFPKLYVEAPSKTAAELAYKRKLNLSPKLTIEFSEVTQCQPPLSPYTQP
jgi:hypothetical protein